MRNNSEKRCATNGRAGDACACTGLRIGNRGSGSGAEARTRLAGRHASVAAARAVLESKDRQAARHGRRDQRAKLPRHRAVVEEAVAHEMQEVPEFMFRQADGRGEQWINAGQHRLDRPEPVAKVSADTGECRDVLPRGIEHVEMVPNRVLQARERAVVEESRLQRHVAKRRAAELVAVRGIAGDLLQPEILVLAGTIEDPPESPVICSSPKSSSSPGPSKITLPLPTPNSGATCGTPATCIRKSLNISFEDPPTAWQPTQLALPKKMSAPRFSEVDIAFV
jgi:hypothetical protein